MNIHYRRREFLRFAAGAGFASVLPVRLAVAAPGEPRRLLLIYHPNGLERGWEPEAAGDLQLSPTLAAFAGLEAKMVVLGGIKGGIRSEPLAHSEGMVMLWTGTPGEGEETVAEGPSLDQRVASRLSATAPFPSIELGAQSLTGPVTNSNVMSYDAAGRALAPQDNPSAAFDRMFAPADAGPSVARRTSVLDYVRGALERVRDLYGNEEAQYLDLHFESIRATEQRLQRLGDLSGCGGAAPTVGAGLYDSALFPELIDVQSELIVKALSCGVTSVASLQIAHSITNVRIPGVNDDVGMHQLMHERTPAEKRAVNRFYIERVAALIKRLEATPGVGEGTLLDETLVIWGTDMSIGNHGNHPIPFFLFGASQRLRGGQYLAYGEGARPRHTRILETAAPILGLDGLGRYGSWSDDDSRGVIEELLR